MSKFKQHEDSIHIVIWLLGWTLATLEKYKCKNLGRWWQLSNSFELLLSYEHSHKTGLPSKVCYKFMVPKEC